MNAILAPFRYFRSCPNVKHDRYAGGYLVTAEITFSLQDAGFTRNKYSLIQLLYYLVTIYFFIWY